ncbi:hypothetical protein [Nocardia salmonicida]|uniref:hypothetical protein n=1 Tax=Nocardia salmonicida TaxID=53431 RepID=UPI0037A81D7A
MELSDWLAAAGIIAGILAALFAALAWLASRQRHAFTLRREGNHVLLTRARRPTVEVRRVYVFGHSMLVTDDQARTAEWRRLSRDDHLVLTLDIRDENFQPIGNPISPHETLTVQYWLVWPWQYRWRRIPSQDIRDARRRQDERGKYKEWHSPML